MAWQFFGRGQTPSQKLLDLLNDDQVVAEICQLPLESLTQGHRYRLRRIYSHWFNLEAIQGDEHEQEGIGDDPAAVRARPRKRRRRTQGERHSASPDTRNPLQRIMNLRVLVVHPEIQAHIHRFRADASAFWNEHSALQLHTMGPNAVFTMTDQFIDCYHYTNSLDARASLDRLRWCFQMMFFSDLVHYIHPTGSGHRPGLLMMEHLQGMLGSVGASGMPLDSAGVLIHLREWSNQGRKVARLCHAFGGAGCLFYLTDIISDDFLKHKMTFTGKYWEPANEHLNALGIHDILAGSIENELGENIRRHLRLRITE